MFILGSTLKRLGWRTTMILGIIAYPIRFAVWAFFPEHPWLIIAVQVLHGVCCHLLLCNGLYFRGGIFPEGCAFQRARVVQHFMILGLGALVAYSVCPYGSPKKCLCTMA